MPKILEEAVDAIMKEGDVDRSSAYAIAISTLQKAGDLHKGTYETTKKGTRRAEMTKAERAETSPVGAKAKRRAKKNINY
ncbi:MAG: hypothetical protein COB09_19150 [Thalassobium sp.]|nr:MAG: hypothetical protein COB09_19150 [Thalassobium sp.]